jgi:hypothetical protein
MVGRSKAHVGEKQSEESKKKKSKSGKQAWTEGRNTGKKRKKTSIEKFKKRNDW